MKLVSAFLLSVLCTALLWSQKDYYEVMAEQGDGIFSLLRKQGLDPIQHYAEFVELNAENLEEGSRLKLGLPYKVPYSNDSFRQTGVYVDWKTGHETSIFGKELSSMSLRSNKLRNTVYYLVIESHIAENHPLLQNVTKELAGDLMVHGAQVFVFDGLSTVQQKDSIAEVGIDALGDCVDIINKRYLKYGKKYQRVLLLRAQHKLDGRKMNLGLFHYKKSGEGQRFADNIQRGFEKNGTNKKAKAPESSTIFEDRNALFLAKNLLPAITLLTLDSGSGPTKGNKPPIQVDNERLVNILSNGMMKDYVDLEIEE